MKKLLHSFAAILLATVTFGITACNDHDINAGRHKSPIEDNDYESSSLAEICPSNIILDPTEEDGTIIELGKENLTYDLFKVYNKKVAGATKFYTLHGDTVQIAPSNDLKFRRSGNTLELINTDAPEGLYVMCVYDKNDEGDWYPITISMRPSKYNIENSTQDDLDEQMRKRAADIMCHPMSFGDSTATVMSEAWLNPTQLTKFQEELNDYPIFAIKDVKSHEESVSGSTNQKNSRYFDVNVGIGCFFPIVGALFNLAADVKHSEKHESESDREYFSAYKRIEAMKASIQDDYICDNIPQYISYSINEALNKPGSRGYKKYADTPDGACKLIDHFGLFLSPTALFGATCSYNYSRTSNISGTDISDDVKVSMSLKKPGSDPSSIAQAIVMTAKIFSDRETASKGFQAKVDVSTGHSEYTKVTHAQESCVSNGGNSATAKSVEEWNATDNPNNWNLLSFDYDGNNTDIEPISILELVADQNSKRFQAIHDVIYDEDGELLTKDCYYRKYLEQKIKQKAKNAIVADVYAEWMKPSDIKAKIMRSPDGVTRLYQPFIFNNRFPIAERERHPVAISNSLTPNIITRGAADGKAMVFFYAMDDRRYTSGLLDIIVAEKNGQAGNIIKGKDYHLRGQSWHEGGGSVSKTSDDGTILDAAIFVRYAPENFPTPITAVGLAAATQHITGGTNFSPEVIGLPFASSLGTELMTTTQGDTKKIWNHYWNPATAPIYFSWCPSETHPTGYPIINVCTKKAAPDRIPEYTIGYWLTDEGFSSPFRMDWRGNWHTYKYSFHVYGTAFLNGSAAQTPSATLTPSNWIQDPRPPLFATVRGNYGGDGDGDGKGDDDNNCFGIVYSTQIVADDYVSPPRMFEAY